MFINPVDWSTGVVESHYLYIWYESQTKMCLISHLVKYSGLGGLEALGDLARYCIAVAATVTGTPAPGPEELTTAALSVVQSDSPPSICSTLFRSRSPVKSVCQVELSF